MKLTLVLADDNHAFVQKLVSMLRAEFEIVATANDGRSALDCVWRHRPDILVLDLSMPLLDGIQVAKELGRYPPCPSIVICFVEREPAVVEAALEAGVLGYVFKTNVASDLIPAIRAAARGQSFVSQR
jgi:DNA-binding NarL/FixJ family response regulator